MQSKKIPITIFALSFSKMKTLVQISTQILISPVKLKRSLCLLNTGFLAVHSLHV